MIGNTLILIIFCACKLYEFAELPVEDNLQNADEIKHILSVYTALCSTSEFRAIYDYTPKSEDYRRNNLTVRNLSTK